MWRQYRGKLSLIANNRELVFKPELDVLLLIPKLIRPLFVLAEAIGEGTLLFVKI